MIESSTPAVVGSNVWLGGSLDTKEPWTVTDHARPSVLIDGYVLKLPYRSERYVAYAHLIAAAPDLLEALRECMADADEYERRSGKKLVNRWPDKARAALAKALPPNA